MASFPAYGGARPKPAPAAPRRTGVSIWRPFARRLFVAIWIAALASNLGTWMQNVGAAWLMTSLAPSPLMVASIQTAASLPIFLLALPAGALADVLDRRRLLIFSQTWMLAAAGALGVLTIRNQTTPALLLALSFLLGVGAALGAPAWQALVPEIVERDELAPAIALNGINFNLARAVGPALGGVVVAILGAGATFILNALSFLGVIAVLYVWKRSHRPGVLPAERVMGAIRAGLRYVRHAPPLRAVLARTAALMVGAAAMWAILPLIARTQLGLGASGYGGLLAAFGAGAVGGGALMPLADRAMSRDAAVGCATVALAAMTGALGWLHSLPLVHLAMAIGGAGWVIAMSELNVAAQLAVPQWVQGRALACYQIVLQGGLAVMSIGWGAIAEPIGIAWAMTLAAAALLVSLAAGIRWRIGAIGEIAMDPAPPVPAPQADGEVDPEAGPVLVSVEFMIDREQAAEFEAAMYKLRTLRRRDGATFWGLFVDAADASRYIEYFVVDTWIEHLRQHERATLADQEVLDRARSFHRGEAPPAVAHRIAASGRHHG
jgi:MFS family permease